jgi:Ni/Co efflux regulator RcnB
MKRILIAAGVLSLLGGSAALAQPTPRERHEERVIRHDERVIRHDRRVINRAERDRFYYHGAPFARFRGPAYVHPRGFAYRSWARGQYLPRAYFAAPYYLDNWAAYRLGRPLAGFRYVRVGPDVLLVNVRTGLISEVIPGVFY